MVNYFLCLFKGDAKTMVHFHKWATIVWFILAFPICIWLSSSIPFLVFISVYAVVTGHWSTWQASKVELKQHEDADVKEVLDAVKEKNNGTSYKD